MIPRKVFISGLLMAVLVTGMTRAWAEQAAVPKAQPQAAVPLIDPRALDTLKLMSDKLIQAKSLQFEARSMVPVKSPAGMWISLYGTSRVVKEGASKLFTETRGDFFPFDFYDDGKKIGRAHV